MGVFTRIPQGVRCFGRSAVDAVWRRAFRAEAGLASGNEVLAVFSDLRRCYEHVRHRDLAVEAAGVQYPLQVLRLSLVLYAAPRRLLKSGAVGPPILPTRSIIAGSAAATYELKALMARVLSRHCVMHPSVNLSFYIDDGVEDVSGNVSNVGDIVSSHCDLVAALESELQLPLAQDKLKVIGSSTAQVSMASRAFSANGLFEEPVRDLFVDYRASACSSGRDLGIDFSVAKFGARARLNVRKKRVKKFSRLVGRIAKLASTHRAAGKLFYTGAMPQGFHGSVIWGIDSREVQYIRRSAARVLGWPGRSNLNMAFAVAFRSDPAAPLAVAPLVQYCLEIWRASSPTTPFPSPRCVGVFWQSVAERTLMGLGPGVSMGPFPPPFGFEARLGLRRPDQAA